MSALYIVSASFLPMRPVEPSDVVAGVLGALHEAVIVEDTRAQHFPGGVLVVEVEVLLAGQGEADDSVERIRNAPGLPPVDNVRAWRVATR